MTPPGDFYDIKTSPYATRTRTRTASSRFAKFHNWTNTHFKRGINPLPWVLIHGVCSCTAIDEMHGRLATGNKGIPLLLTSDCTEFSNRAGYTRRQIGRQTEGEREGQTPAGSPIIDLHIDTRCSQTKPYSQQYVCRHLSVAWGNTWNASHAILFKADLNVHETRTRTTLWRHSQRRCKHSCLYPIPERRRGGIHSHLVWPVLNRFEFYSAFPLKEWLVISIHFLMERNQNCKKKGTRYEYGPIYYKTGTEKSKIQRR